MNFKAICVILLLPLEFFVDINKNIAAVSASAVSTLRPCWEGEVHSNSCVDSFMKSRGWSRNLTLTNIATVERLLAERKIPTLQANPNSINLAVGCLHSLNLLPIDGDCSACGIQCATTLKTHTEFCALYCPIPPPFPPPKTTRFQLVKLTFAPYGSTPFVGIKIEPQDHPNSLQSYEGPSTLRSSEGTSTPVSSLGNLVGAVIIGLVTLVGAVGLIFSLIWLHCKGDPASSNRRAQLRTTTAVVETNICTSQNVELLELAAEKHETRENISDSLTVSKIPNAGGDKILFIDERKVTDDEALDESKQ